MLHVATPTPRCRSARDSRGRGAAGASTKATAAATPRSSTHSGTAGCSAGPITPVELIRHGDLGYVSVWTPDADRAAAFYGHVLGWTYDPSTHQVTNTGQPVGIFCVDAPPTMFCCYAVDDLQAAARATVDAGGQRVRSGSSTSGPCSTRPTQRAPRSRSAARPTTRSTELNGAGPANCPMSLTKSATPSAFREFYGRVSGLDVRARPSPGRVAGHRHAPDGRGRRRQRRSRPPCRCGRWPTSTTPSPGSARPAAPCCRSRTGNPTA